MADPPTLARDVMTVLLLAGHAAARQGRPVDAADLLRELAILRDGATAPRSALESLPGTAPPLVPGPGRSHEVTAALRELAWRRRLRPPAWDDTVPAVLEQTLARAAAAGVRYASTVYLVPVLAPGVVLADAEGEPYAPLVAELDLAGGVEGSVGAVDRLFRRIVRRSLRRAGPHGVVVRTMAGELVRQAVRAGHGCVTTAHGVLAILALDHQLAATGRRLAGWARPGTDGGEVLRRHGVAPRAGDDTEGPTVAGEAVFPEAAGGPPWSEALRAALDRTVTLAAATGDDEPGTGHLLVELLATEGAATRLVRSAGADPAEVADDARALLAHPA